MTDMVNNPPHYQNDKIVHAACGKPIECIEVVRHFNYGRGNAIKYVWRAEYKGKLIEDLKKAVFYLNDEIKRLTLEQEVPEPKLTELYAEGFPVKENTQPKYTTMISVYIDIDVDPFKAYAINAHHDWTVETVASLVATLSKEWACGTFTLEARKTPYTWKEADPRWGTIPREWTVGNFLRNFPADRYDFRLKKVGL